MTFTPELNTLIVRTPDLLLRHDLYRSAHDPKFPGKESVIFVEEKYYDDADVSGGAADVKIERFKKYLHQG